MATNLSVVYDPGDDDDDDRLLKGQWGATGALGRAEDVHHAVAWAREGGMSLEDALKFLLVSPAEWAWIESGVEIFRTARCCRKKLHIPEPVNIDGRPRDVVITDIAPASSMLTIREKLQDLKILTRAKDTPKVWPDMLTDGPRDGRQPTWEEALAGYRVEDGRDYDQPYLTVEQIAWLETYPHGDPESEALQSARVLAEIAKDEHAAALREASEARAKAKHERDHAGEPVDGTRAEKAAWRRKRRAGLAALLKELSKFGIIGTLDQPSWQESWSVEFQSAPEWLPGMISHFHGYHHVFTSLECILKEMKAGGPRVEAWLAQVAKSSTEEQSVDGINLPIEERVKALEMYLYTEEKVRYWTGAERGAPGLVPLSDSRGQSNLRDELVESEAYPGLYLVTFQGIKRPKAGGGRSHESAVFHRPATGRPLPWHAGPILRADDHELIAIYQERTAKAQAEAKEAATKRDAEAALARAKQIEEWTARRATIAAKASALGVDVDDYEKAARAIQQMRKSRSSTSCLVCGKKLSDRTSVVDGIGPECRKTWGVAQRLTQAEQDRLVRPVPLVFSRKALEMELARVAELNGRGKVLPTSVDRLVEKLRADGHTVTEGEADATI